MAQAMGVLVSGPGSFECALMPPTPPPPTVTNLDVTTLCALVSEVSNGDPKRPALQAWAQRVTHWQVRLYTTFLCGCFCAVYIMLAFLNLVCKVYVLEHIVVWHVITRIS